MVFYAAFHSISGISRRQLTLFMLCWVSPVLGWALKCLAQGHSHKKKPRASSAARTQDLWFTSQTLYHRPTRDPDKTESNEIMLSSPILRSFANEQSGLIYRYSFCYINNKQLLKTLWEKEKCSQRAISPFPTIFSTQ